MTNQIVATAGLSNNREYRSQPEVAKTIANDIGRDVVGGDCHLFCVPR